MYMQKIFNHIELPEHIESLAEMKANTGGDGTRTYSTPVGNFPSVTTVVGWEKQKFFAEWRRNNPQESKRVLRRGNNLHNIIEDYLNNEDVDLMSLDPNVADLFVQIKPELDKIDNVRALEVALFSRTLELAGRVDCIAEYNGTLSVIDFKGSTRTKRSKDIENYHLQATAYCIMWQERTGIPIKEYNILVASEDRATPQVFTGNPVNHVVALRKAILNYQRQQVTV